MSKSKTCSIFGPSHRSRLTVLQAARSVGLEMHKTFLLIAWSNFLACFILVHMAVDASKPWLRVCKWTCPSAYALEHKRRRRLVWPCVSQDFPVAQPLLHPYLSPCAVRSLSPLSTLPELLIAIQELFSTAFEGRDQNCGSEERRARKGMSWMKFGQNL